MILPPTRRTAPILSALFASAVVLLLVAASTRAQQAPATQKAADKTDASAG